MVGLVKFFAWCAASAKLDHALACGRFLGWLVGSVFRIRRKVVTEQLTRCFPERPPEEIKRIADQVYQQQGMNVIEMLRVSVLGLEDLEGRITIENRGSPNIFDRDYGAVLALMAHVGNWELVGYSTKLSDREATVVVKPIKNQALNTYIKYTREKMGVHMLPHRDSFRDCLRVAKAQKGLAIVLDQNRARDDGIFVDFFGKKACTSIGLAVISQKTKLPVHPLFCMRKPNHRDFTLLVGETIEVPPDHAKETMVEYTQKYTNAIENIIREYPAQWLWLHKRWKTQPLEHEQNTKDT